MVKITFPDGVVHEYEQGVTGLQIAESISPALARDVVSCGVNGETVELNRPILEDADFVLYKFEDILSGIHRLICSQKPSRNCIRAYSSVSDRL